jgi:invasion protein IalB
MPVSIKRIGAVLLAASLLASAHEASAQAPAAPAAPAQKPAQPKPAQPAPQPAPPAAPAPAPAANQVNLQPSQSDWTKVCGKDQAANKEICYTTRDFGQAPDQPPVLALAVYDVKGDDNRIVRFLLPPALLLRPGIRFSVDKGAAIEGTFEICFPNGCFAEAKVRGPTIDQIKKGSSMNIFVKNQFNNEIAFVVPLSGFGKSFDGPPIDPKVLEEQQNQLREEMQKRAEEERKRLESQTPAPAGVAPAAPAAPK